MSSGIGRTDCEQCHGVVVLVEEWRFASARDMGTHRLAQYGGRVMIARARCADCGAAYTAWHNQPRGDGEPWLAGCEGHFIDLSYRQHFNDEPGPDDMPMMQPGRVAAARKERALTFERAATQPRATN